VSADDGIWKRFADGSIRLFDVLLQESAAGPILDSLARIIGETLGVDRSQIFDISLSDERASCITEWLNPKHPQVTPTKGVYPLNVFRSSARHALDTHDFLESHATAPHPMLVEEGSVPMLHGTMGIQSLLWYPFAFRDDGFYVLAFNHVVASHQWTPPELSMMRTAARHVSMALVKQGLEDELRKSLSEKEVLLKEIHHRVRNNLQMITSLLHLQLSLQTNETARAALVESENRVHAIALAHDLLYELDDLSSINIGEYLQAVARQLRYSSIAPPAAEMIVTACDLHIDIQLVVTCGLIVTELVENALAYAFPDERSGHIWVNVGRREGAIALEVRDDGIGLPPTPTEGFGLHLVRTLAHRLGGRMTIVPSPGCTVRVVFTEAVSEAP
jgi:two-component sensor histidine kinase